MAVTIKQIAELACVSRGTVDKVLNNRPGVKAETKEKVLRIAKELNYHPNFLGKALVQSREPTKIGIVLTPEHNPFIKEMLSGIQQAQEEFSAFGIEVTIKMPISLEPAEQISILNEMELNGMDGIALFPLESDDIRIKINQLTEKGISVLTCNSKIDGIHDFCFIGQNHYKGGAVAASLMSKLLPGGGKIGVIISSYHLSCHRDRLAGFTDKLKSLPAPYEIAAVQENQDRKDMAFQLALRYLNQHPDLKGIYVTGGGAGGIGSALDMKQLRTEIVVICHDLTPDSISLIKDGTIDFAIGQNPQLQGYQVVKVLFEYLVKKQKPEDFIEIPITIYIGDSI